MRNTIVVVVLAVGVLVLAVAAWWLRPQPESQSPVPPVAVADSATTTGSSASATDSATDSATGSTTERAAAPVMAPKPASPATATTSATAKPEAEDSAARQPEQTAAADSTPPPSDSQDAAATAAPEAAARPETMAPPATVAKPETQAKPEALERTAAPEKPAAPASPPAMAADDATGKPQPKASEPPAPAVAAPTPTPPSFDIVRIARDGTAVIAGRAMPNATIVLRLGDQTISEVQANRRGEWVAVIGEPLPPGTSSLQLEASDSDGTVTEAAGDLAVIVPERPRPVIAAAEPATKPQAQAAQVPTTSETAATEPPRAAQDQTAEAGGTALAILVPKDGSDRPQLLQKPEPAGKDSGGGLSLDAVDYDDKGNVVLSGNAPAGSTVRTYIDNKIAGESTADASRNWEVKPPATLPAGNHTLRVDQLDDAGKVASRVELPFTRVAADKVLAASAARYRVVVQPGNSLWRIARRVYGRGTLFTVIYRANDGQIRDPDMIYPGQVFDLPETRQN